MYSYQVLIIRECLHSITILEDLSKETNFINNIFKLKFFTEKSRIK